MSGTSYEIVSFTTQDSGEVFLKRICPLFAMSSALPMVLDPGTDRQCICAVRQHVRGAAAEEHNLAEDTDEVPRIALETLAF